MIISESVTSPLDGTNMPYITSATGACKGAQQMARGDRTVDDRRCLRQTTTPARATARFRRRATDLDERELDDERHHDDEDESKDEQLQQPEAAVVDEKEEKHVQRRDDDASGEWDAEQQLQGDR